MIYDRIRRIIFLYFIFIAYIFIYRQYTACYIPGRCIQLLIKQKIEKSFKFELLLLLNQIAKL